MSVIDLEQARRIREATAKVRELATTLAHSIGLVGQWEPVGAVDLAVWGRHIRALVTLGEDGIPISAMHATSLGYPTGQAVKASRVEIADFEGHRVEIRPVQIH